MIALILMVFAVAGVGMIFYPPKVGGVVFAIGYACVSLVFIVINFYIYCSMKRSRKFVSAIPLVGGLYGAIAMALVGGVARWLFWIPIIMDWGCLVIFITIYKVLTRKKK